MKKFQFRLEGILRYHQQRLKQAELRLAQAARWNAMRRIRLLCNGGSRLIVPASRRKPQEA